MNKSYLIFPGLADGKVLVWEFSMEKYDSSLFFDLGYSLMGLHRELELKAENDPLDFFTVYFATQHLGRFADKHKELKSSSKAALKVIDLIENYDKPEKGITAGLGLPGRKKTQLKNALERFQSFISEEIPRLNIFYVNKHRAYDMNVLIEEGENLLSSNTLNSLEASKSEVVNDIREAARSLAFGIYTATGFHLYRAIESVTVEEYLPLLGISVAEYKDDKNCPNFGNCIGILEGQNGKFKITAPVDVKITSILRHIVKKYRNPIMHPDAVWGEDDANAAIGLAVSIIDMMAQDIAERKKP